MMPPAPANDSAAEPEGAAADAAAAAFADPGLAAGEGACAARSDLLLAGDADLPRAAGLVLGVR